MSSLLQIVVQPLLADVNVTSCCAPFVSSDVATGEVSTPHCTPGFWNLVQGPSPVEFGSENLWKNLLNWRAFTRKNRSKVMV